MNSLALKFSQWQFVCLTAGISSFVGCAGRVTAQGVAAQRAATPNVVAAISPAEAAKVVYQWNPENFRPSEGNPWKGESVTRPDGSITKSISGTGAGYNNYLYVPKGKLLSGHEYTAIIKYEIVAPTRFPDSFYMFARSSKLGQEKDYWQLWNGDAGKTGIAKLTMSIKGNRDSDDWAFFVGCKGPGTMIIDSFQIIEGTGLDYVPAAVKPAAFTPAAHEQNSNWSNALHPSGARTEKEFAVAGQRFRTRSRWGWWQGFDRGCNSQFRGAQKGD